MKHCPLANNEIHSWIIQLDTFFSSIPTLWEFLSIEERSKSKKFAFDLLSKRYIVSHGILRLLLSRYLDSFSFQLQIGRYGKPYLKDSALFFNLSHSNNYAAITLAFFEVGTDIEFIKEDEVLTCIFSEKELLHFHTLSESQKLRLFYQSWTRKEAYLKALGVGLTKNLEEVEVSFETPPDWSLLPLDFDRHYVGTVASKVQLPLHKIISFQADDFKQR